MAKIIQLILLKLIAFYRYAISLLLGNCCRFEPSCSVYAQAAIQTYGIFKGCYLSARRILRCHPWHAGGLDPVP